MADSLDEALDIACAERLVAVLLPLMRQLSAETEAAGGDGLTMAQFRLLAALVRRDYTAGELAGFLGVAASTVSGLVAPLVKRGLVVREQTTADRRVVALRVTERGTLCYQRMQARVQTFLAGVFVGLPAGAKRGLLDGLNELDDAIARQRADQVYPNGGYMSVDDRGRLTSPGQRRGWA